MLRRRLSLVLSLTLLVVVPLTFLTGFIAVALDLNRFVFHKYMAYLVVILVVAHVVVHWRRLRPQIRRQRARKPELQADEAVGAGRSRAFRVIPTRRTFLGQGLGVLAGVLVANWWSSQSKSPTLEAGEDLGQVYHQWSKPSYGGILAKTFTARPQPSSYKEYPGLPLVALLPPEPAAGPPLEAVIQRRRSAREYASRSVTLRELSNLLHYSTGITDRRDLTLPFRAAPSAGALYPIEIYPMLFKVEGAPAGVYHYDVQRHRLELLREGDVRTDAFRAGIFQEVLLGAALVVVLTAVFARLQWKYSDRSYRYALLEAGHIGQNVYLEATSLGLGARGIGAFLDEEVNGLVEVDGREEATVYMLAVGPTG